ncbi:MAG: FtsH protease activity modulator HflK [Acidobacteria bacterium]|nr:FtsH protease activity modulator HflK [Acidobacteriota bacterium]
MSILDVRPPASLPPPAALPELPVAPPSPRRRRIAAGVGILWLLTSVYMVRPEEQAVVTRFGAVVEPRVLPGIHLALPWPLDRVTWLKVRQLQRLVVGGDLPDAVLGRSQPLVSQFLTGDQNIINMRVVVQYSVGVPSEYLFQTQDVGRAIGSAVESELARRIAHRGVDEILTTGKAAIQEEVRAAAQQRLNQYRSGVELSTVNIESVTPPPEAADAFRDVASARADQSRIVNQAQGYANDVIPKARGEARQMLEAAAAYRQKKINEASGDASRFSQLAAEYSKAAEVTGERLYQEAMAEVLPRIKKVIVDKNGNLDLTIIRKGDPPPSAQKK